MATIIAKVTEACNSNCIYCDVVKKDRRQTSVMHGDVLEELYIRVYEYLRNNQNDSIEIMWHGGEPLLAGVRFFEKASTFLEKYCSGAADRIRHTIQTNLTVLTKDFIPVLRRLGINSVGTSYDPLPGIRGPGQERRTHVYNKMFMRGIEILKEASFGWGVIYVVTKLNLKSPRDIFFFMTNLRPNGGVSFNPVLLYGNDPYKLSITPEEFVEFLGDIFQIWWPHRERYRGVQPFQSFVDNIFTENKSLGCCDSGSCYKSHINLAPDGSTSQCGRSADWELLDYGSLFDRTIEDILSDIKRDDLRNRNLVLTQSECKDCRFWSLCHGGCPLDAWAKTHSFMHKTPWCYVKHGFIEKYFEPTTGIRYTPFA